MAAFILDASVAVSWCFPDDSSENTRRILAGLVTDDAAVPEIWALEIANSIFVSFNKRKRINERQITEYLTLLQGLPIRVEGQPMWANIGLESLSRRHEITAYDAAYLDLALRAGLPLATSDETLSKAATAEGVVVL
jgi:predicted nucleic acid-binding protein